MAVEAAEETEEDSCSESTLNKHKGRKRHTNNSKRRAIAHSSELVGLWIGDALNWRHSNVSRVVFVYLFGFHESLACSRRSSRVISYVILEKENTLCWCATRFGLLFASFVFLLLLASGILSGVVYPECICKSLYLYQQNSCLQSLKLGEPRLIKAGTSIGSSQPTPHCQRWRLVADDEEKLGKSFCHRSCQATCVDLLLVSLLGNVRSLAGCLVFHYG